MDLGVSTNMLAMLTIQTQFILSISLLVTTFRGADGVKVFINTNNLTEQNPRGGATLQGPEVDMEDISVCIRFKFQVLGKVFEGKGRIITMESWR